MNLLSLSVVVFGLVLYTVVCGLNVMLNHFLYCLIIVLKQHRGIRVNKDVLSCRAVVFVIHFL